MTIVFSAVLGVFAMALVLFMFQKCKHKIQYLPQPLTNSDDAGKGSHLSHNHYKISYLRLTVEKKKNTEFLTDAFVTDEDTLVISGGLYDGHPIYDNVPTAQERDSQFRLEFLH